MRKVTKIVVGAFLARRKATVGNTFTNGEELYLHGNRIARHTDAGIEITNCGWTSSTTKERLNAIPGVSITQKNWEWDLNGEKWNGTPTVINQ